MPSMASMSFSSRKTCCVTRLRSPAWRMPPRQTLRTEGHSRTIWSASAGLAQTTKILRASCLGLLITRIAPLTDLMESVAWGGAAMRNADCMSLSVAARSLATTMVSAPS